MKSKIDVTEILQWREENKATTIEAARHFLVSYNRLGKAITRFNKGEKNVLLEQQASTLAALLQKKKQIDAKIEQAKQQERESAFKQIRKLMVEYKISRAEIVVGKKQYKNPATGQIWSGRGSEPQWLKGKDRNLFLVTE